MFSGGQTRGEAGPRSEGITNYRVAEHFGVSEEGLEGREGGREGMNDITCAIV